MMRWGVGKGLGLADMFFLFLTPPLPTSSLVNLESSMWISGLSAAPLFDRTLRFLQSV